MKKIDLTRRKFLGRTGTAALVLPLAAAIPAAIEATSPNRVEAAMEEDDQQQIPNRAITARTIGTGTATANMPIDGSDCSSAIQAAITSLGSGGGIVTIPWNDTNKNPTPPPTDNPQGPFCEYYLDIMANSYVAPNGKTAYYGVKLANNVRIQAAPGVVIKAMPTHNGDPISYERAYMFLCQAVNNVEFCNLRLVGERYTHDLSGSSTDEWCHGIQIIGAQHVTVRACIISDCTGDGICVGRYNGVDPSDIIICDVVCTGNRRQALSLTGGDTLQVYDSEFSNTYGTAPQNGIDIEPMGGANLSNITIDNCLIRNNSGDGIELNANGTATSVTNLTVQNCLLAENYWHGIAVHGSGTIDTGGIYGNAFYQNGNIGLSLADSPTNYTIGALNKDGNFTNNFANNNVGTYSYPNNTSSDVNGYVAGDDMHLGPDVIGSSSNVVRYNRFFS